MTRLRVALLAVLTMTLIGTSIAAATASKPPAVTPKGATVSEGTARAYVVVTLKSRAKKKLRIPFKTIGGTAKPSKDYKSTRGKVTIKKGARSARIPIKIINDRIAESTETFTVKFTGGSTYRLTKRSVSVKIKDNDGSGGSSGRTADDALAKIKRWTGDITVHVTKHQPSNPTIVDEDWTFVAHLVLAPEQGTNTWLPTPASTWSLNGNLTTTDPSGECASHPDRKEINSGGTFMANPFSGFPSLGQAQYSLRTQVGGMPNVFEAGVIHAAAKAYSYWDYTHTCSEHVTDTEASVVFQTHWRTADPVAHPGTFPLTLRYGRGTATTLTADFTDDYSDSNHAGWTTHSRVTGTLQGMQ